MVGENRTFTLPWILNDYAIIAFNLECFGNP